MKRVLNSDAPSKDANEEAARWLARHDAGDMSGDEVRRFDTWLKQSEEHQAAFESIEAAWSQLGRLAEIFDDETLTSAPDADILARRFGRVNEPVRRRSVQAAIAALMVISISGYWLLGTFVSDPNEHTTEVGEIRTVRLADGSTMVLNTNTRVLVDYDAQRREVNIYSGEAYFAVSHDPERAFWVKAGNGDIKAIGTEFNVRLEGDHVDVVVTEGMVELSVVDAGATREGPSAEPVVLRDHQQGRFGGHVGAPMPLDVDRMKHLLSWREKRLYFDDEPLAKVIEEIERFTRKRIFIGSDSLRDLRVGGVYEVGDLDSFVSALQDVFPINVLRITPYVTILLAEDAANPESGLNYMGEAAHCCPTSTHAGTVDPTQIGRAS